MSFHAQQGPQGDDDEINLDDYSTAKRPPLVPDMFPRVRARTELGTGIYAALTVVHHESVKLKWGRSLRVVFAEYPEHNWWTNLSMLKILVDKLGKSPREWYGARVPLTKAFALNPQQNKEVERLYPVQATEWDEALDAYDRAARAARRTTKAADGAPGALPAEAAGESSPPAGKGAAKRARKKAAADPDAPPF